MYLVSQRNQTVRIGEHSFEFSEGEAVLTEYSHKYTIDGFEEMASHAGFTLKNRWTDDNEYFAVLRLVNQSIASS